MSTRLSRSCLNDSGITEVRGRSPNSSLGESTAFGRIRLRPRIAQPESFAFTRPDSLPMSARPASFGLSKRHDLAHVLRACGAGLRDRGGHGFRHFRIGQSAAAGRPAAPPISNFSTSARSWRAAFSYWAIDSRRCFSIFSMICSTSASLQLDALVHLLLLHRREQQPHGAQARAFPWRASPPSCLR